MSGSEFPRLNLVEACEYNIATQLHVVVRQKKKEKIDRTRPLHQKQNKKSLANFHLKATVPLQWHFGVFFFFKSHFCIRAVVRDELAADVFNFWLQVGIVEASVWYPQASMVAVKSVSSCRRAGSVDAFKVIE